MPTGFFSNKKTKHNLFQIQMTQYRFMTTSPLNVKCDRHLHKMISIWKVTFQLIQLKSNLLTPFNIVRRLPYTKTKLKICFKPKSALKVFYCKGFSFLNQPTLLQWFERLLSIDISLKQSVGYLFRRKKGLELHCRWAISFFGPDKA